MKKSFFVFLAATMIFACSLKQAVFAQWDEPQEKMSLKLFYVYADQGSSENHFIPSGWMGDYQDLIIDTGWKEDPYSGTTCIKIVYKNKASQGARWAGMYWQEPANNWGTMPNAGYDLTGVKKLTFWARGKFGGERLDVVKVGGIAGLYPDTATAARGPVILTNEWQQYTIDLTGKNLSHIIGGFCWAANLDGNPQGCTFYLDEIRFE